MSNATPTPGLFVERLGTRHYQGANDRGATLEIGMGPGQWSPGELLKLALLGCQTLSSDQRLADVLGDDFTMGAGIVGYYNEEEDRYESFETELLPDFSKVDAETVKTTVRRALGAIDRQCTIGHTLERAVPHPVTIESEK